MHEFKKLSPTSPAFPTAEGTEELQEQYSCAFSQFSTSGIYCLHKISSVFAKTIDLASFISNLYSVCMVTTQYNKTYCTSL